MTEVLIRLPLSDGEWLAFWKYTSETKQDQRHVFLTHGTFSNRRVLRGIAGYLVEHGFTCWVLEWRNHGASSKAKDFNFETIAKEDVKIAFDHLTHEEGISSMDCITHSGGGICLTIALIEYPNLQTRIKSITLFGCQAFGAAYSKIRHYQILFGKYFGQVVGFLPGKATGGVESEPYSLMKQWFNWNLQKQFIDASGRDLFSEMKNINVAVLSIYGEGDTFIAPPVGCELFLSGFQNLENKALKCGIKTGYAEDYDHSRILHSRSARKEIYPKVLAWIRLRSTALYKPSRFIRASDLQSLRSLKLQFAEGNDAMEVIDDLIPLAKLSVAKRDEYIEALNQLKNQLDQLAKSWLQGTLDSNSYTLQWDEIVRGTLKIMNELDLELSELKQWPFTRI